jgi:hypothetical protein
MRRIIISTLIIVAILQGCSTQINYVQIWKTEPIGMSKVGDYYVFENDTLKIVYYFWGEDGVMAFSLYNKTNKPIYIDWKKSTFISNAFKSDYWFDKITIKSSFAISNSSYSNIISTLSSFSSSNTNQNITINRDKTIDSKSQTNTSSNGSIETSGNSNSLTQGWSHMSVSKQERITFLPPRTYIDKAMYKIHNNYYGDWKSGFTQISEALSSDPKKTTIISTKTFTNSNTPLDFRNFLTLSFKEDFSTEFYIDNEFYIKEVTSMEKRQFYQYKTDRTDNTISIEILPKYKQGNNFFIKCY